VCLENTGVGFDPANLLYAEVRLPNGISPEACWDDSARFSEQLARIPGVGRVALADADPLLPASRGSVTIEGRPEQGKIDCSFSMISADYFATTGIPVRAGTRVCGLITTTRGSPRLQTRKPASCPHRNAGGRKIVG